MLKRLRDWLFFPVRTPTRAVLSAAVVALLVFAGWYGLRVLRFHNEQASALQALANYDFPEAQRRLMSCLDLRPSDPDALLLAAQAARRDGRLDEAQEYLDRYPVQTDTLTPDETLQSVLLRVQQGMVKQYVHALIDHIEIRHPASEQILEALAQGCVHVYRLDEASFWTKQLLDRFSHNPIGRLLDAQTNETMRRREKALQITRSLVEDYPGNDKARLYLAGLLVKTHKYDEAATHYQELHRRQPADLKPLLGLVGVLLKLERFDEAGPYLRELEDTHADNSVALLECGRYALYQKRLADAESLLRRAVQVAPFDHEVHFELAVCLQQLNRKDEAQRHLERFQEIEEDMKRLEKAFQGMVKDPADPAPRLEAGRLCLRNGQVTEGLRWLFGVLDLVPNHKATHEVLADHFDSVGDSARAKHHRARAR